jgi:hypothetical protein
MMDKFKVALASVTGMGTWLLEIDVILKIGISGATLFYIILKCKEQLKKR